MTDKVPGPETSINTVATSDKDLPLHAEAYPGPAELPLQRQGGQSMKLGDFLDLGNQSDLYGSSTTDNNPAHANGTDTDAGKKNQAVDTSKDNLPAVNKAELTNGTASDQDQLIDAITKKAEVGAKAALTAMLSDQPDAKAPEHKTTVHTGDPAHRAEPVKHAPEKKDDPAAKGVEAKSHTGHEQPGKGDVTHHTGDKPTIDAPTVEALNKLQSRGEARVQETKDLDHRLSTAHDDYYASGHYMSRIKDTAQSGGDHKETEKNGDQVSFNKDGRGELTDKSGDNFMRDTGVKNAQFKDGAHVNMTDKLTIVDDHDLEYHRAGDLAKVEYQGRIYQKHDGGNWELRPENKTPGEISWLDGFIRVQLSPDQWGD